MWSTLFIEKQINGELQKAKQYGTKNKRQALQHLKKKKRLEQQLEQVDNTGPVFQIADSLEIFRPIDHSITIELKWE